jgi:hypothetical protein
VAFVVYKVTLGQVFSEYFDFPCQFSFHRLHHTHNHALSGADTIGEIVAGAPSRLSLTPLKETSKNLKGVPWDFFAGVKLPEYESGYSHPSNAEVKNGGAIPPYVL